MDVDLIEITPNSEKVIEIAGRTAYLSYEKMEDEDSTKNFIRMIIKRGHESVLEHAYATFRIAEVSRAFSHQLVRHRIASYTQQSQRYVNERNFHYVIPKTISESKFYGEYIELIDSIRFLYEKMQKGGIPNEDARFILPNGCHTTIVMSANFREWRHFIKLRTSPHAQWEIRRVAKKILDILKHHAPNVFMDLILE